MLTGGGSGKNTKPKANLSAFTKSKVDDVPKPGPIITRKAAIAGGARSQALGNAAPPVASPISRGGGGGGGAGIGGILGGGGSVGATDIPVGSQPVGEDDYLAGDSSYQLQLAALMKALQDGNADFDAQGSRYTTDYNDALKGLGWKQDDPNTPENEGAWDFNDVNTASGRSFQNQQNDFASRGLIQSSLYGTANDNLTRSLNDQLGSVNTAKTNFMDDLTRKRTGLQSENTLSMQQARAEALARRAAGVQL